MSRKKQDEGFSLIEVVVALGVLSTAAISLSTLATGSVSGAKQIEARYLARTVADNQLTKTFTQEEVLRIGVSEGEAEQLGQSFTWIRTVAPTPQEGIALIEVQVTARGEESVLVKASTLKELRP